jgi:hypothetical protein
MATPLLGERHIRRRCSASGRLMARLLNGKRTHRGERSVLCLLVTALFLGQLHLCQCCSVSGLLLATLLISLLGQCFLLRGRRLSLPFIRHCRSCAAFLLVLQAVESGLTLLLPQSLASEPGVETLMAKPQEDDSGCRRLSCVGSTLATSSLLVEDALATHSLLAFECSLFIKKALSGASSLLAGGLLAFVGGTLVKKALAGCCLEAVAFVLPQFVNRPLPILVGAFRAGASPKKNGPPRRFCRQ